MVKKNRDTSYWELATSAYYGGPQDAIVSSIENPAEISATKPANLDWNPVQTSHISNGQSSTEQTARANSNMAAAPAGAKAADPAGAQMCQTKPSSTNSNKSSTGTVIAVTSGKGGVGKSTVSLNLAIVCAQLKNRVLLMDGDLGLANINLLMGMIPRSNIFEVIKGEKNIRDVIVETNLGIDIVPGASGVSQIANISQEQRQNLVAKFMDLSGYDIMIVDTGAGVSDNVLDFAVNADQALVVTTPEPTAIIDAYGMIKSIVSVSGTNVPICLVINKVRSPFEAEQIYQRLLKISRQFLKIELQKAGYMLEADTVKKSVLNLKPFITSHPHSQSSICMRNIGQYLLRLPEGKAGGGIPGFLARIFGQ